MKTTDEILEILDKNSKYSETNIKTKDILDLVGLIVILVVLFSKLKRIIKC